MKEFTRYAIRTNQIGKIHYLTNHGKAVPDLRGAHLFETLDDAVRILQWIKEKYKVPDADPEFGGPMLVVVQVKCHGRSESLIESAEPVKRVWPDGDIVNAIGMLGRGVFDRGEGAPEPVESGSPMRFEVKIDPKIWSRFEKRMQERGVRAQSSEKMLETVLATVISDPRFLAPAGTPEAGDSTTVMVTLGRIVVRQLPEDA